MVQEKKKLNVSILIKFPEFKILIQVILKCLKCDKSPMTV